VWEYDCHGDERNGFACRCILMCRTNGLDQGPGVMEVGGERATDPLGRIPVSRSGYTGSSF